MFRMPAEVITTERYAVYSTDGSNDDKSICSERNSFIYRDPDCTDLTDLKHLNGKIPSSSPALSTTTIDKWGSYWSKRERCCCFWNFLLTVSLIVTVTVVILATKGVVFSSNVNRNKSGNAHEQGLPGYIAPINVQCTNQPPLPKTCEDDVCLKSSLDVLSKMNTTIDPCQDFYSYACGGFMDKVRLSWNSPRKRMDPDFIMDKHVHTLLDSLSEDIQRADSGEVRVIKKVYKSCVQHKDASLLQVRRVIDSLGGFEFGSSVRTKQLDLTTLLSEVILKYGISPLFDMDIRKDGKICIYNQFADETVKKRLKSGKPIHRYKFLKPSDFYYRNEDTDLILQAYKKYISDFLAYIMGINSTVISDERFMSMVDDIYHLSVFMNRVFYTEDVTISSDEMSRCKSSLNADELQAKYNYNISWNDLLSSLFKNTPFFHNYTICKVSLTTSLSDVLSGFTFTTLKRYIILQVLTDSDISLLLPTQTPKFKNISWNHGALFGKNYAQLTDYDCLRQISKHLPMYYVILNHLSDQLNDTLMRLFTDLISSIEGIIRDLYWIPIKQKQYLLTELKGLTMHLEWQNTAYESLITYMQNVTDDYFDNIHLMINYRMKRYLSGHAPRVFMTEDSSIFSLTDKELEIPASVMQVPFIYASAIPSLWLGSAGTYISQAISQLFDIEALLRFLTEDKIDHKVALTIAFRLQCLLDEYNKYHLPTENGDQEHIRGDLTKSANFKDSLALRVVYDTYSKISEGKDINLNIPGVKFTHDQLFFLSYAQSMCEKTSIRGTRLYYIDTASTHHSPGKYRVIGTLSHFKKFAEAFRCPPSSEMNPKNKCTFF
ncbi:endothelin-converting enzyme 1-like [Mercenaria mercenaria]|uniref:endothelin-converting enzyme 1-like n=1 Tax=Mercenaria mercenaria TaxID=6596 RepID=UPI00234F8CFB|nr:endothelin-converting enzyme 1-like [Mercenaria mercenaria]